MKNIKITIALLLLIFAGLFAGAQNKFLITNLKIEHDSNQDGNIDARITFTYKQTEGYVDKVSPRLAVDGVAIRSSYQGGFNGGALRLESNGVLNLRTGMEEMPKDLSTNTLIPKLSDGKHTLNVKFEGYTSSYGNKFIAIESNVATVDFWIGNKGSTTPANNNSTDNSSNDNSSDISSTEEEIVVLTDDIGSNIVQLFWDPATAVNNFGEVWIDTISATNGNTKIKEYTFQQIASYEIPAWKKDKYPNAKQSGNKFITSTIFYMRYKFVVMKGSVYFDRSNGRVATAPNTVAYIDEFQKGEMAEGDSHWRTLVLQANKYYRGTELHILVKDYFSGPLIFPESGVKASFSVRTPTATASVRGTEYEVIVLPNGQSEFFLYEGAIEVNNLSGNVLLKPGEMITVSSKNSPLQTKPFNNTERYIQEWYNIISKIKTNNSQTNNTAKKGTNPLFANVTIGGKNWIGETKSNITTNNAVRASGDCLGQLKVQFIVPVGTPVTQQQQFQMKALSDRNNFEKRWFQQAEAAYKNGASPKPLSGTYRPDASRNPGQGKYYSETVTIFKPMKITVTGGDAEGFRLVHGDSNKEQHFSPISNANGTVLQCGSYKIYVDPNENREKSWVTVSFSEPGSSIQNPQTGNGNNTPSNPPPTSSPKSCTDQLQVQFIQKTGAVNDPQGRMIMMKLDDENKRESYWFNQAKENFNRGILPHEIAGTYRRQANPGPLSREFYCETVTLFEPMKMGMPSGLSQGFTLMKDSREYRKFNSKEEAAGVILPCGSYKAYPNIESAFSNIKIPLTKE